MKKTIVWLLCAAMLLGVLTGCGSAETEETAQEAVEESTEETAEETQELPELLATLEKALDAFPADTLVMTVNGQEVTWENYYYWLSYLISNTFGQYNVLPNDFSIVISDDLTMEDVFLEDTENYLKFYYSVVSKAQEEGISLTAEEEAELQTRWEETCALYGGEEAFVELMLSCGITAESYRFFERVNSLGDKLKALYYGENGEAITREDAETWAEENNMVRTKHILIKTVDDSFAALSEDEVAAARSEMEDILAELQALAGDPAALEARFDEIMKEESEDPGVVASPDGYFFTTGEMVAEFEEAAFALEEYGLSEIVESSYGYHILLRLPMDPDAVYGMSSSGYTTLRQQLCTELFGKRSQAWMEEAEAVMDPAFTELSLNEVFFG